MRLFLACDLSDATRAAFRDVAARLRAALPVGRAAPRVVWVADHAAHVTLRFIGEVPDATLLAIEAALGRSISHRPIEVTWQPLGTFPTGRRPRVVWMGPAGGEQELVTLAACVNQRLDGVVTSREGRAFAPHVTIARIKDAGRGVDWTELVARVAVPATITRVDHVTLYQSRVTSKGSTYTERLRIPLQ